MQFGIHRTHPLPQKNSGSAHEKCFILWVIYCRGVFIINIRRVADSIPAFRGFYLLRGEGETFFDSFHPPPPLFSEIHPLSLLQSFRCATLLEISSKSYTFYSIYLYIHLPPILTMIPVYMSFFGPNNAYTLLHSKTWIFPQ